MVIAIAANACGGGGSSPDGAPPADGSAIIDANEPSDAAFPPCIGEPATQRLAFAGNLTRTTSMDVFVLDVNGETPGCLNLVGALPNAENGAWFVDWSSDGRILGWVDNPSVYLTDVSGEPPWPTTELNPGSLFARDFAWPVDDRIFVQQTVAADRSEIRAFTLADDQIAVQWSLSDPFVAATALAVNGTGTRIVFNARTAPTAADHIYWVDLTGSAPLAPVRLDPAGMTAGPPAVWSPDAENVALRPRLSASIVHLYVAAPSLDDPPVRVHADLAGWSVPALAWSDDGAMLAFEFSDSSVEELYVVDVVDGQPTGLRKVNNDAAGDDIYVNQWGWIGASALYYRTSEGTFVVDAAQATPVPVELAPGLVQSVMRSPDGMRVAFSGLDEVMNTLDVWVLEMDGVIPQPAVRLTTGLASGSEAYPVAFSPDGSRLMYARPTGAVSREIHSVDVSVDPIADPILLYQATSVDTRDFYFSPDSQLVATSAQASPPPPVTDLRRLHVTDATQASTPQVAAEALQPGMIWATLLWAPAP